jgi:hypothetical protein
MAGMNQFANLRQQSNNLASMIARMALGLVVFGPGMLLHAQDDKLYPGEIKLTKDVIYPATRRSVSPSAGREVAVNPPVLLWPPAAGKGVRYDVRLSQDSTFASNKTIVSTAQVGALFNPHKKLAPGTWYWQWAVSGAGKTEWSKPNVFQVAKKTRVFETATAKEMLAGCPRVHPRLLVRADGLAAFRNRVGNLDAAVSIVNAAKTQLDKSLPSELQAAPQRIGTNKVETEKLASDSSKDFGQRVFQAVFSLSAAYLITGDEQYAQTAICWALRVASWDRAGPTGKNNFGDMSCMDAMVTAYDSCYPLLSDAQKQILRNGIHARAGHFFQNWTNRLEAALAEEHAWQHILFSGIQAAFATLGEIDDAEEWLSYAYEVWLARAPTEGLSDGGWTVGLGYFDVETESLRSIPLFFQKLTGVNLFNQAFFRNNLYYVIYAQPPHSYSDGFGDGHEKGKGLPDNDLAYIESLAARLGDPYASWYANKCREKTGRKKPGVQEDWNGLVRGSADKPPPWTGRFALPQARAFRETGIVEMHTDLANTENDVFVSFRSSPWGSYGHAHADQNTFNVLAGGERLFYSSGYKVAELDPHVLGWYKHTAGHNGVLIDAKGQTYGSEAYGWIPRYLHGEHITYCVGDASGAYDAKPKIKGKQQGPELRTSLPTGDAGLTRFRRHVALLRPSTIVVYDELTANHEADWSWLLHSLEEIRVESGKQRVFASAGAARGRVDLFGSAPLKLAVANRFSVPAINWRDKAKDGKQLQFTDNQWHLTVMPARKLAAMRFLAVLQVRLANDSSDFAEIAVESDGWMRIGDCQIRAELDRSKKPALEARSAGGMAGLVTGKARLTVDGKSHDARLAGGALLVEKSADKWIVQETVDELPEAAR